MVMEFSPDRAGDIVGYTRVHAFDHAIPSGKQAQLAFARVGEDGAYVAQRADPLHITYRAAGFRDMVVLDCAETEPSGVAAIALAYPEVGQNESLFAEMSMGSAWRIGGSEIVEVAKRQLAAQGVERFWPYLTMLLRL
jgi:hypothetical protein